MPLRPSPIEEYSRAVAQERAAWEAVRHRLPGCPNFSHELWNRWRTAVDVADDAAARAHAFATPPARKTAGLGFFRKALPPANRLPQISTRQRGEGPPP